MISLIANIIAFGISTGINFFLTPYIVGNVGSEAYAFVSLANNFTGYAQILVVALNSMAGRFITIAYHQGKIDDMNKYFSSVIAGNVIMSAALLIPAVLCVAFLDKLINISPEIVPDIKILFAFMFLAFFVTLINSAYATATFAANRKDIEAKINIGSYVLKALALVLVFSIWSPRVCYIGAANLINVIYILGANYRCSKKLVPGMDFRLKFVDKRKLLDLIKSGIWNSVGRLSAVLSEGLDLLITNLFISPAAMGVLAVAKVLPGVIMTMISTVAGVFGPNYTIAFARRDKEELVRNVRQSIIILSVISNICLVVLISAGTDFFKLWVPGENAGLLQLLSVITAAGFSISGGVQCMFTIYTVTNKVSANAVASVICSVLNIIIVFILLKTTKLGIIAVAGVSTAITIVRNLCFSIPYAAKCINVKWRTFFAPILINVFSLILCSVLCTVFKRVFVIDSWVSLIVFCAAAAVFTAVVNTLISTNKEEKKLIMDKVICMIKK